MCKRPKKRVLITQLSYTYFATLILLFGRSHSFGGCWQHRDLIERLLRELVCARICVCSLVILLLLYVCVDFIQWNRIHKFPYEISTQQQQKQRNNAIIQKMNTKRSSSNNKVVKMKKKKKVHTTIRRGKEIECEYSHTGCRARAVLRARSRSHRDFSQRVKWIQRFEWISVVFFLLLRCFSLPLVVFTTLRVSRRALAMLRCDWNRIGRREKKTTTAEK